MLQERDNADDIELPVLLFLCEFRSLSQGDHNLEFLGMHEFDLFGDRDRRDELYFLLLMWFLALSRFNVFYDSFVASEAKLLRKGGTSSLYSFPVSA